MRNFIFIICLIISSNLLSQENDLEKYKFYCAKADSFLSKKEYQSAVEFYSKAFQQNNWKGTINHRYCAGFAHAQIGNIDSAFYHLNRLNSNNFLTDTVYLLAENRFTPLMNDSRWNPLYNDVKQKQFVKEAKMDRKLMSQLDEIFELDQKYRQQLDSIEQKFGMDSKEIKQHWKLIQKTDDKNLKFVKKILDTRGWLGADVIGFKGNGTLFLVIQHADLKTQQKYLPMMREAVSKGNAQGSDLALLEDRVAIGIGNPQIYGSQVGRKEDGTYFVIAMIDPDKVDERRNSVGLPLIAEYTSLFGVVWNLEEYKKSLPELLKLLEKETKKK